MNWGDIKDVVGKAAPLVGTLLGGPAGATVGALVASALGTNDNPDAVVEALANPEKVAELRKWAYEHKEKLEQIQLDTLRAELGDKANAREHHKYSPIPAIVTLLLTCMVGILGAFMFLYEIPTANKDVAFMLFGQISALWGASITYWVGTTRSSSEKTKMMGIK